MSKLTFTDVKRRYTKVELEVVAELKQAESLEEARNIFNSIRAQKCRNAFTIGDLYDIETRADGSLELIYGPNLAHESRHTCLKITQA